MRIDSSAPIVRAVAVYPGQKGCMVVASSSGSGGWMCLDCADGRIETGSVLTDRDQLMMDAGAVLVKRLLVAN